MANANPPKKNTAYSFEVSLVSQLSRPQFQNNPTLAAGDVLVSLDAGAFNNIGTLPSAIASNQRVCTVALTAAEMNADRITILFHDAAGAEWDDLLVDIFTNARTFDDLAFPNTSGRGIDVSTGGAVGVDWANVESPTTTVGLSGTTVKTATDVEADTADIQSRLPAALVSGRIDSSVGAVAAGAITAAAIATGAVDADALATDAVNEIVDATWNEVLPGAYPLGSAGNILGNFSGTIFPAGAIQFTYTVTSSATGLPIEGVEVWFSTDIAGTNVVWKGDTDTFGIARDVNGNLPMLDAGMYYVWRQKSGYTFSDPDMETVS